LSKTPQKNFSGCEQFSFRRRTVQGLEGLQKTAQFRSLSTIEFLGRRINYLRRFRSSKSLIVHPKSFYSDKLSGPQGPGCIRGVAADPERGPAGNQILGSTEADAPVAKAGLIALALGMLEFLLVPTRPILAGAASAEVARLWRSRDLVSVGVVSSVVSTDAIPAAALGRRVVRRGARCRKRVGRGRVGTNNDGVSSIQLAQSALLAKTTLLAETKQPLQLLQPKSIPEHGLVGPALCGSGLTPAAEIELLAAKKNLAKLDKPFQLLQLKDVVVQLLA
jgi:hypothetical protein